MPDLDQMTDRPKKDRSPSFPFISLPKALDRAGIFAASHKRVAARVPAIAETWGYGTKSSGLLQTIAALKAYGLLEDFGSGTDRKLQISDLAWRIMHDARPGARDAAINEAALRPRLIAEYARVWLPDRPSDAHCISELQFERGFTAEAAKLFLRVFDETASFANLREADGLSHRDEDKEIEERISSKPLSERIGVGDLVQWESQGVWQFPEPRRVREIKYDAAHGSFVFVEGAGGGFPLDQAVIVERRQPEAASITGAISGSGSLTASAPRAIYRATFPLPEGLVALEMPDQLSVESLEDLEAWLEVMMRRAKRSVTGRAPSITEISAKDAAL